MNNRTGVGYIRSFRRQTNWATVNCHSVGLSPEYLDHRIPNFIPIRFEMTEPQASLKRSPQQKEEQEEQQEQNEKPYETSSLSNNKLSLLL